jgi:putative hemin transport protein
MNDWLNALDPMSNLHLKTTGMTEPWRVRKPGVDGIITRYEGFDTRPPLIG